MLPLVGLMHVASSPGQTFGVSVFNPSIRAALDLSHSRLTGSYLMASLLAAVLLPAVGWSIDRYGLRRTGIVVIVSLGLACMATARATSLATLTFGFLLLRAFGQGALTLVASNSLAMWFSRRLGLISGLTGVVMSAAVAVLPTAYLSLIQRFGWRAAYVILGVITWAVLLPFVLLLFRNCPEDIGQTLDGIAEPGDTANEHEKTQKTGVSKPLETQFDLWAAWHTRAYWIALSMNALWGMVATAVFFNIVPLCESQGLSQTDAAATFTTFAICTAAMQVFGGMLADRLPLNLLLAASAAGLFAGVVILWNADARWMVHLYAVSFGAAQGSFLAVGNTLWPRYFGRVHLGRIRSSVWTATVASCSLGPFLMGVSMDYLGSYGPSLALFAVLLAISTFAGLFATPPTSALKSETNPKCE